MQNPQCLLCLVYLTSLKFLLQTFSEFAILLLVLSNSDLTYLCSNFSPFFLFFIFNVSFIFSLELALTFEDKGSFQSHFQQIQTPKHILKNKLTKIFPTKDYNPNKTPPFAAAVQMPVVIFKLELPMENNNLSKVITVDDLDNSLILET